MSIKYFGLLGLLATQALAGTVDYAAAAKSISAELASPSFKAYAQPTEKVQEFIALGDSWTAGAGSNGEDDKSKELIAGKALRGGHAYPIQMSRDGDSWALVNSGDHKPPRFSFHAYTGDTSVELASEQLKPGDYKDDLDEPRGQPFGKPQLAVVTVGGSDAGFPDIWNDCVYQIWRPNACKTTLDKLQADIKKGVLRDKIYSALYNIAKAGRQSKGAKPPENFQVYALEYVTPFDDAMSPECNIYTWAYWFYGTERPLLDRALRESLNNVTRDVNSIIKSVAADLLKTGVIYVGGIEDAYKGHRFCESKADREQMESNVWFWSQYANYSTTSEGPAKPDGVAAGPDLIDPSQELLDFVFAGQHKVESPADKTAPWKWKGAEKYPSFKSLTDAIQTSKKPLLAVLRSFHPKGRAYSEHAKAVFATMRDNRGPTPDVKFTKRCKDSKLVNAKSLLVTSCTDKDGKEVRTEQDLNQCLRYDNKALIPTNNGQFMKNCVSCFFWDPSNGDKHTTLWCDCKNDKDDITQGPTIKLDDLLKVQKDGHFECSNHVSTISKQ